MILQIYRPDIVVPLSEYAPPAAVAQTARVARARRVEDEEAGHAREDTAPTDQDRDAAGRHSRSAADTYESVARVTPPAAATLRARDIMTPGPVTLALAASTDEAMALFRAHEFHHLPLVDDGGRIAGIVSEPYLLRHMADARPRIVALAELAATAVLTATGDTALREIAAAMLDHRAGCVPVVDARGYPVGIITRSDILRALVQRAPLELWA